MLVLPGHGRKSNIFHYGFNLVTKVQLKLLLELSILIIFSGAIAFTRMCTIFGTVDDFTIGQTIGSVLTK